MATLNFPSNPNANDTYSFNGRTWTYNGSAWDLTSATLTTTNVVEGANLYFTNTRAISSLTAGSGIIVAANGLLTITATSSNYTDANVYANVNLIGFASNSYVNTSLLTKANTADLTTANVLEVNNLYFTNTRAVNALTAGSGIVIASNGLITANVTTGASSFNSLIGKPANVININNSLVSYYETYNILSFDKNTYRSGEVRYNIIDDNTSTYSSVAHNFIHGNNNFSYSNTLTSIGSSTHSSHMALVNDNIVLFIVSSNVYATNYFLLSSENYQQNVTANLKGYVSLIEV